MEHCKAPLVNNKPTCKKKYLDGCFDAANMIRHYAIRKRAISRELGKRICLERVIKTDLCQLTLHSINTI